MSTIAESRRDQAAEPVGLFDLDGSLADFDKSMKQQLSLLRSPTEDPTLDETAYEDVPHIKARRRMIKSQPGFWRNLERIELGFQVFNMAKTLAFTPVILSKGPRKIAAAWEEKVEWCVEHVPNVPIILSEDKGLVYGKFLCDDWPLYIERWLTWRPRGLVIAVAQPWNVDIDKRFADNVVRFDGTNVDQLYTRMSAVRATAGD